MRKISEFVDRVLVFMILAFCVNDSFANHHHHHQHRQQHSWFRTEILDGNGLYVLDWKVTEKDIVFRATVNTRGYIGLGFSYKSGKVSDSDIILGWVDDQTGEATVLVSFVVFTA